MESPRSDADPAQLKLCCLFGTETSALAPPRTFACNGGYQILERS
jgi:hypothetical protein